MTKKNHTAALLLLAAAGALAGCEPSSGQNDSQTMLVKCMKGNLARASVDLKSDDFKKLADQCASFIKAQEYLCAYTSDEEQKRRNDYEASLNPEALKGFKEICGQGIFDPKNVIDGANDLADKVGDGLRNVSDGISEFGSSLSDALSGDSKDKDKEGQK